MMTIDTTNMCSHLQRKLFEEDGEYHSLWMAMQDDPELTAVVRSRQLHIYRNGTGYRWAVKRDDQNPNKELQQLFTFAREGSDDKDLLREDDHLHIEIRSIDQKTYDYFYSMQIMDNTGTNPLPNFTGGCLGYFSAYSQITYDCDFHEADVEDEE